MLIFKYKLMIFLLGLFFNIFIMNLFLRPLFFLVSFVLPYVFSVLMAIDERKTKIDTLPMWEQVMSNLPADKFQDDVFIDSLTIQELGDWTKDIAQTCLRGKASLV